jgi:iron(III) transport system substrate-binding protein
MFDGGIHAQPDSPGLQQDAFGRRSSALPLATRAKARASSRSTWVRRKDLRHGGAGFAKKTGVKTTFLRLSAGEAINRIRAERNAPQASVLYGIGLPSMLTLKADGCWRRTSRPRLRRFLPSTRIRRLVDRFRRRLHRHRSNKKFLQEKGSRRQRVGRPHQAAVRRADLRRQSRTSGTGYTFLTTILQLMGEQKGWDYLKRFNTNVSQYTRSGIGPTQLVGPRRSRRRHPVRARHPGSIDKGFPIEMSLPRRARLRPLLRGDAEGRAGAGRSEALHRLVADAGAWSSSRVGILRRADEPKAKVHDLVKPYQARSSSTSISTGLAAARCASSSSTASRTKSSPAQIA